MISGHGVPWQPPVLLRFSWLVGHFVKSEDSHSSRGRLPANSWRSTFCLSMSFITLPVVRGGGDLPFVIQEQREGKWSLEIALQRRLKCLRPGTCIFCFINNIVSHVFGMREPQVKAEAFPTRAKGAGLLHRQNPGKLFHCFQSKWWHIWKKIFEPFEINPVYFACMNKVANVRRRKTSRTWHYSLPSAFEFFCYTCIFHLEVDRPFQK